MRSASLLAVVLCLAVAGCGGGGGASVEEVEQQLDLYGPMFTRDVSCVEAGDDEFDCILMMDDGSSRLLKVTCDDENCIWRETSG